MPHKIAFKNIEINEEVFKFGNVIGYTTKRIRIGEHVHVHNVDSEKLMK